MTIIFLASPSVRAQSSAETARAEREAREHDKRAFVAVDHADAETARREFLQSYALLPATATLWNLLLAETDSNHPLDALKHLRAYLKDPHAEPKKREQGKGLMAELMPQISQLKLAGVSSAKFVTLDGIEVSAADEIDVIPGKHVIEAVFGEERQRREVDAPAGKETIVTFDARPNEQHAVVTPAPVPQVRAEVPIGNEAKASGGSQRTVGLIVGGAGVALLATGIFFDVRSITISNQSDDEANAANEFARKGERASALLEQGASSQDHDSAVTSRTIGIIATAAGVAGLATGAWLVLTAKEPASPESAKSSKEAHIAAVRDVRVEPFFGATASGARVSFAF